MQEELKFDVEIADASGHSTVQMSQNELADKASQTQGSWVFVNDQLVSAADVADMNLEAGSRMRLMPGLVGGRVSASSLVLPGAHTAAAMTQPDLAEKASQTQGSWVFVNDQLVSTADVANMNLEAGSRIRLMPGLVGGSVC